MRYLRLIGNFSSQHLENVLYLLYQMVLPFLKELDISESPNIRPEILEYLQGLTVITNWDRHTTEYMSRYADDRNIILKSNQIRC